MKVPLSWLREFVPLDMAVEEIGATLDDLGLVVEGIERVGEGLDGVVVARVAEIAAIAGADRIRRVLVDAGVAEPVQVVCGAWNFAVGDTVPLATVGAVLPGDFEITARKMKGVESRGMLCSGRELGLSDDAEGILVCDSSAPPGSPFAAAMGIEPDAVFDLAVEGNRPDALCIAGVARDLAARLGVPFMIPELPGPSVASFSPEPPFAGRSGSRGRPATVAVECPDLCDRFGAWVIEGVRVGPSPEWMQRRLSLAGMRPINNVVDVSNYVMLEVGQPNHPYDLDALGGGGLVVREATVGEKLETLDGTVRVLGLGLDGKPGPRDCVIAGANGVAVGIAGIMGGSLPEIGEATTTVLLEVAHFAPMAVARTSKRLGLRTEASVRFERGCDPAGVERAGERFAAVLAAVSPEDASGSTPFVSRRIDSALGPAPVPLQVRLRVKRVNALLGTDLAADQMAGCLGSIGFGIRVSHEEKIIEAAVPTFRPDCEREIDLIEEIARIHGYSRIPRTALSVPRTGGLTGYQRERRRLREVVAYALGACEAWTPSFLPPGDNAKAGFAGREIFIANPVAREESVLRQSMLPGMLVAASRNASHRNPDMRLFEIGHVFEAAEAATTSGDAPSVPDEREVLGVLLAASGEDGRDGGAEAAVAAWRVIAEALRLEGVAVEAAEGGGGLHPSRSARLVSEGVAVGSLGEVAPAVATAFGCEDRRIGWIEVALGWESAGGCSTEEGSGILSSVSRRSLAAQPVSNLPSSDFDLAFVVSDAVPAAVVESTLVSVLAAERGEPASGEVVAAVRLFDVFRGAGVPAGSRSLAYRVRLEPFERTLTDADIAAVRERCIAAVASAHGAALRG